MSNKNNTPNAAETAALGKNEQNPIGDASVIPGVNPVVQTQSGDQNASAPAVVNTASTVETQSGDQNASAPAGGKPAEKVKEKLVKITFTLSPCGVFKLPYNVGQTVSINENQANVIVEAGYAKFSK